MTEGCSGFHCAHFDHVGSVIDTSLSVGCPAHSSAVAVSPWCFFGGWHPSSRLDRFYQCLDPRPVDGVVSPGIPCQAAGHVVVSGQRIQICPRRLLVIEA